MSKKELRQVQRARLAALSAAEKQNQSTLLSQKMASYLRAESGHWGLYYPLSDEPQLLTLVEQCSHLTWCFPRTESDGAMTFRVMPYGTQHFELNSVGVREPSSQSAVVATQDLKGCLIPGLAFDAHGVRLGRGGGYYDRFLKSFKGHKLGVAFDVSVVKGALPREPHDQVMNIVASPQVWLAIESEVSYDV